MNPTVSDTSSSRASGSRTRRTSGSSVTNSASEATASLAGQQVEQRRLAGVGVADQRDGRHVGACCRRSRSCARRRPHVVDLALRGLRCGAESRRRSVSSFVSPGPRVPMPPPSRDSAVARSRPAAAAGTCSCASSTCSLPSRVRARRAKMSRISCVRSTTLRPTRLFEVAQLRRRQLVVEDDERRRRLVARDARALRPCRCRGTSPDRASARSCSTRSTTSAPAAAARPASSSSDVRDRAGESARVIRPTSAARSTRRLVGHGAGGRVMLAAILARGPTAIAPCAARASRRGPRASDDRRRRAAGRRPGVDHEHARSSARSPSASATSLAGGAPATVRARRGDRRARTPRASARATACAGHANRDASGARRAPRRQTDAGASQHERQRPGPERRGQPRRRARRAAPQSASTCSTSTPRPAAAPRAPARPFSANRSLARPHRDDGSTASPYSVSVGNATTPPGAQPLDRAARDLAGRHDRPDRHVDMTLHALPRLHGIAAPHDARRARASPTRIEQRRPRACCARRASRPRPGSSPGRPATRRQLAERDAAHDAGDARRRRRVGRGRRDADAPGRTPGRREQQPASAARTPKIEPRQATPRPQPAMTTRGGRRRFSSRAQMMADGAGAGRDREQRCPSTVRDAIRRRAELAEVQRQHRAEAAIDELQAEDRRHQQHEVLERAARRGT